MLINLSKRGASRPQDLVDLLGECHTRIRRFVVLAREAARRQDAPADQIVQACADVERYFTEALPLHVLDEEQSVAPRLRGLSPEVDRALASVEEQHRQHAPKLDALLRAASAFRMDPLQASARRALATAAAELEADFTEHLALEEAVIFPAIRQLLPAATQARIIDELRQRRHDAQAGTAPSAARSEGP